MDTKTVHYFSLMAEHKDLKEVSRVTGDSEKIICSTLDGLQAELGCTLLFHTGDTISLTDNGEHFLRCAHVIDASLQDFFSYIRTAPTRIPVSISLHACSELLAPLFTSLKETHKTIDLSITQNTAESQCDFSIVTEESAPTEPNKIVLLKEPLYLAVNKKHPFGTRKSVDLSELASESFIIQRSTNPLRKITESNCLSVGFTPKIIMETDNNMAYSKLISANCAVGIVPAITNQFIFNECCSLIEIKNPSLYRYLVLKWEKDRVLNEACITIRDFLSSYFENLPVMQKKVFIHTFGQFDVYVNDVPVYFSNKKSKELLALLIDRQGGTVTMEQAVDCLWESEPYDEKIKRRYRSVIMALRATLKKFSIEDIVTFQRAGAHVNKNAVICDLFEFMNGTPTYVSSFMGDYMLNYSWGELTLPLLIRLSSVMD
ncbi:MAG: LysR substrate-binding domain-containing protein [Clostridia bacterium]|nr:LysR substrate-binding domain-containing protein [Clostridia bacterium]